MNNNYMEQVAHMLGVELNEKFDIENCSWNPCKLTEDGLLDYLDNSISTVLEMLLTGRAKLIKKPWVPRNDGDVYYYINVMGEVFKTSFSRYNNQESMRVRMGNCFRTKEEAEKSIEKWLEYIKQEPDFSWRVNMSENYMPEEVK